jgi:hypothetical protein
MSRYGQSAGLVSPLMMQMSWYGRSQVHLPQGRRLGRIVGVEGVHAVVLGGHVHHVVRRPLDAHILHIKRLGIDLAVHRAPEQLAKAARVHVRRVQHALAQVLPRAPRIIVLRQHRHLRHAGSSQEQATRPQYQ